MIVTDWFKRTWKAVTAIIGALVLIGSVVSAVLVAEDRYIDNKEHFKAMENQQQFVDLKVTTLEKELVMTLKQFQETQNRNFKEQQRLFDYKYYMRTLKDLDLQILKVKMFLKDNPNDQEARKQLRELEEQREETKNALDNLLING